MPLPSESFFARAETARSAIDDAVSNPMLSTYNVINLISINTRNGLLTHTETKQDTNRIHLFNHIGKLPSSRRRFGSGVLTFHGLLTKVVTGPRTRIIRDLSLFSSMTKGDGERSAAAAAATCCFLLILY